VLALLLELPPCGGSEGTGEEGKVEPEAPGEVEGNALGHAVVHLGFAGESTEEHGDTSHEGVGADTGGGDSDNFSSVFEGEESTGNSGAEGNNNKEPKLVKAEGGIEEGSDEGTNEESTNDTKDANGEPGDGEGEPSSGDGSTDGEDQGEDETDSA